MLNTCSNSLNFIRIIRILSKYDALFFLKDAGIFPVLTFAMGIIPSKKITGRDGERLAAALVELGPTFVKFGQSLAIRPDVIGEEVAADLSMLQDRMPSFSTKEARAIIEKEFGKNIGELFSFFDDKPVAAASISQVHFVEDKEGNKLAVKILRPDIKKKFERDIDFLYWLAKIAKRALPKRIKPVEIVDIFAKSSRLEMDLRLEAAAASELHENMQHDKNIYIPKVHWEYTSQKVLTLERVSGIRIDDKEAIINAGQSVDDVLQKSSEIFFLQVFRDGFFHADMHPGNLFVGEDGRIIAVDFGIMGRIDNQSRIFLAEMLIGFQSRDYKKVSDVHFEAGYIPPYQDRDLFAQACRSIGEPIFGKAQGDISLALLLGQLFKVAEDFEMEVQPQLLLLQKTMVVAEGLGRKLNPDINFWELSKPLIEQWAREHLGLEAKIKGTMSGACRTAERLQNLLRAADNLPDVITNEGIKLHPDTIKHFSNHKASQNNFWKITTIIAIFTVIYLLN